MFVAVFTVLFAGVTAAMIDLPAEKYAPLRVAVARAVLDAEVSQNQTSSFVQLSDVLNNWSGINKESNTHAIVDTDLLVTAFNPRGVDVDVKEYIISYEDLGFGLEEINDICDGNSYNEEEHLLLVRVGIVPPPGAHDGVLVGKLSFLRVMKEDRNNLKKQKSKSKKKQNQRRNGGGQFTKVNEVGDAT